MACRARSHNAAHPSTNGPARCAACTSRQRPMPRTSSCDAPPARFLMRSSTFAGSRRPLGLVGVELSAENHWALYVPKGFAHGFVTLADATEVLYMISVPYAARLRLRLSLGRSGRQHRMADRAFRGLRAGCKLSAARRVGTPLRMSGPSVLVTGATGSSAAGLFRRCCSAAIRSTPSGRRVGPSRPSVRGDIASGGPSRPRGRFLLDREFVPATSCISLGTPCRAPIGIRSITSPGRRQPASGAAISRGRRSARRYRRHLRRI